MAIMVTPKLANLPDVTTTTPSDGQVLTYDDASGKWINEDAASGLALDGSDIGATAQAQAFTAGITSGNDVVIDRTAGSQLVFFFKHGGVRRFSFYTQSDGTKWIVSRYNDLGVYLSDPLTVLRSNGYIGINNGGPQNQLDVSGGVSITGGIATGKFLTLSWESTYGRIQTYNDSHLALNPLGNSVGVGTTTPSSKLHVLGKDSTTNAVTNIGTLTHNSTGTPAAGFGAGLLFQLETSTTESQDAARISAVWSDATHATRTGDLVFSTVSGGAALSEKLRLTGAGILKFSGTMGNSTKVPGTDAPADWVQIDIGGTTYYLPAYAA